MLKKTSLKEVAEYYQANFGEVGNINIKGENGIKSFCWLSETISKYKLEEMHFELVETDFGKFEIHFHLEKKGRDKIINRLGILMKFWGNGLLCIFDKKIQYKNIYKGWIYIKQNDLDSAEKICTYINEFVYQIKSRVESVINRGLKKS